MSCPSHGFTKSISLVKNSEFGKPCDEQLIAGLAHWFVFLELCVPPCLNTRYDIKKDSLVLDLENDDK